MSAVFLYGSKEDYNRWGELVGDEGWKWERVQKSFQKVHDVLVGSECDSDERSSRTLNSVARATIRIWRTPIQKSMGKMGEFRSLQEGSS